MDPSQRFAVGEGRQNCWRWKASHEHIAYEPWSAVLLPSGTVAGLPVPALQRAISKAVSGAHCS